MRRNCLCCRRKSFHCLAVKGRLRVFFWFNHESHATHLDHAMYIHQFPFTVQPEGDDDALLIVCDPIGS